MNLVQKPILRIEDFPQAQQSWLGSLFSQLNPLFASLNQILNQNIDFATNIPSVTSSYSISGFQPFGLQWKFVGYTPSILEVGSCFNVATGMNTILLAAWSYDSKKGVINVTNMFEVLSTGNVALTGKYTFNVRVSV